MYELINQLRQKAEKIWFALGDDIRHPSYISNTSYLNAGMCYATSYWLREQLIKAGILADDIELISSRDPRVPHHGWIRVRIDNEMVDIDITCDQFINECGVRYEAILINNPHSFLNCKKQWSKIPAKHIRRMIDFENE